MSIQRMIDWSRIKLEVWCRQRPADELEDVRAVLLDSAPATNSNASPGLICTLSGGDGLEPTNVLTARRPTGHVEEMVIRMKGQWLRILLGMVALMLVASGCDWTMFGYGPSHTHDNTTENATSASNVSSLVQLYTGQTSGQVNSPPAVANGVVYVGSEDHKLYAFAANGVTNCSGTPNKCTPLWTATTGAGIQGGASGCRGCCLRQL